MLMYFIISFVITVNSEYRESSKWVKAVICAVTFVMQVIMIIKNYHKYEALKRIIQCHHRFCAFSYN